MMLATMLAVKGGATDWLIGVFFLSVVPAIPALMRKRGDN